MGNDHLEYVRLGSLLVVRSILLVIVASAAGAKWLIEQPSSSLITDHPRWQHLRDVMEAS